MAKNVKSNREPTHEEISERAHRIYEMEGRPEGKSMEHWLQAETELNVERKALAGTSPAPTTTKSMTPGNGPSAGSPGRSGSSARTPSWQTPAGQPATRN